MSPTEGSTVILLRTHRFDARDASFAGRLVRETGMALYVVADETNGLVDCSPFPKISLVPDALGDLGLYRPKDAAWRCGDYCFYLARHALPDVAHFWLVEPDVRFGWDNYGELFDSFHDEPADFIAPFLKRSEPDHFWYPTMRWMIDDVYRCFFAFCRLSAPAADICLGARQAMKLLPAARIMWPNDETFVSSIVMRHQLSARDMNSFGQAVVNSESFGFLTLQRGEQLESMPPDALVHHPVLFAAEYDRKANRAVQGIKRGEVARLKLLRGLVRVHEMVGARTSTAAMLHENRDA